MGRSVAVEDQQFHLRNKLPQMAALGRSSIFRPDHKHHRALTPIEPVADDYLAGYAIDANRRNALAS